MKRHRLRSAFVALLCLLILAGFWHFENSVIQAEEFRLASARLPDAFSGFRIVEIADLHGADFGDALPDAVAAAAPDLIALDGDLADERSDLESLAALAGRLTAIAPVCYVSGNHEWRLEDPWGFFSMLEDAGVTVLHNAYRVLERDGQTLVIAGVDDPNGPADQKTPAQLAAEIRAELGDPYIVLLAHRNDRLDTWSSLGYDVVLCGHAHGGLIRLPFAGGLIGTDRSLFPDYDAGLYTAGRTQMVVSRGLGRIGLGSVGLPVRLFNRPHLPVIVLETV